MLRYKEIFLGSQCNNKCPYCPVCHKDVPQPDFNSLLDSLKKREDDNVDRDSAPVSSLDRGLKTPRPGFKMEDLEAERAGAKRTES